MLKVEFCYQLKNWRFTVFYYQNLYLFGCLSFLFVKELNFYISQKAYNDIIKQIMTDPSGIMENYLALGIQSGLKTGDYYPRLRLEQ